MRIIFTLAAVAAVAMPLAVSAQTAPAHYTAEATPLGVLLDDPAAKAVLAKALPNIIEQLAAAHDQVANITLKTIQSQAGVTDAQMSQIDYDLSKLPAK